MHGLTRGDWKPGIHATAPVTYSTTLASQKILAAASLTIWDIERNGTFALAVAGRFHLKEKGDVNGHSKGDWRICISKTIWTNRWGEKWNDPT